MRVFVYEYTCAEGLAERPELEPLRVEGQAMLRALLEDFARAPGVEAMTLLAEQEPPCPFTGPWHTVRTAANRAEAAFQELASTADVTVVIAPESHGLLWDGCRRVEEVGGRLLGPSPAAVWLAGD